MMKKIIDNQAC